MRTTERELTWPDDLPGTIRALRRDRDEPLVWLDDARRRDDAASLIAFAPLVTLRQARGASAELCRGTTVLDRDPSAWHLLRRAADAGPRAGHAGPVGPGWLGYLAFELAGQLERLPAQPADALDLPLIQIGYYADVVLLDHAARRAVLSSTPPTPWDAARRRPDAIAETWNRAAEDPAGCGGPPPPPRLCWDWNRAQYLAGVRRVLAYIAAGDIYQANLAQRATLEGLGPALENFIAIRTANPAEYGALLAWDDCAVLSHSPELFLSCEAGRVLTRPIKGTRRRGRDEAEDAALVADLLASEKEAAELAMIVDLHRNDLGRVCRIGSVRVAHPRRVERHPSVIHTVADVVGELADGRDSLDLLAACFPAGSISGVPKIRALEIIAELEPVARGAYTGAVLNLTCGDALQANVAIRTLQQRGGDGALWFGGGIVIDSSPEAEFEETFAKAGGILRGLGTGSGEGAGSGAP